MVKSDEANAKINLVEIEIKIWTKENNKKSFFKYLKNLKYRRKPYIKSICALKQKNERDGLSFFRLFLFLLTFVATTAMA